MKTITLSFLLLLNFTLCAQNDRYRDENTIYWGQIFTTIRTGGKWDILAEAQFRRTGQLNPQQNLYRTALQYRMNQQVSFALGYGYIDTYTYGDFPLAPNGTFPEHRIFEQVMIKQPLNKLLISHRFRIEQRWLGRRIPAEERIIEDYTFLHRFRYMLRLQQPIVSSGKLYAIAANEIFIGAGKNVGVNIFDQNRIQLMLGAKLSDKLSVEAGYLNQTVMQGRRVNDMTIMQHNNGISVAGIINF